jgi:predicted AAA+ superfamily ATPase
LIDQKSIDPKNIFYLNRELYEFESVRNDADFNRLFIFYKQEIQPTGKIYVFIDEVQHIDQWEKIVVSLAQHITEDYELFITGSNSRLLSGEFASLLSGRYLLLEVFPFSYPEFLDFFHLQNNKENFIRYISTSGLPEIYNITPYDIQQHYFQSLKDTILLKDIMYRYQLRDYILLEDLFLFLLHNIGNLVSIPSIVKYYKSKQRKADYNTISAYIEYMEDAFILRNCPKFSLKTKELLSGEKKYYINDLGFRNYLYPRLTTDIASMLENTVYLHLRMQGFEVKAGYHKDQEIDFISTKGADKNYIQVTYLLTTGQTVNREFRALESVDDNYPKYLISMDDLMVSHPKGIIHQHIWDFIATL